MCIEYGPSKKHILQPLLKKWPCFTRVTMTTGENFWKFWPKNENSLQAPSFHVWFSYERNEHMSGTKPWKSHEYWPDVIYFWHWPFQIEWIFSEQNTINLSSARVAYLLCFPLKILFPSLNHYKVYTILWYHMSSHTAHVTKTMHVTRNILMVLWSENIHSI